MSASARFAFYLDLISNAGKKSEQEARLVEQAQRRMADATDRTDHSVVKLERSLLDLSRNTSTERQIGFMNQLGRSVETAVKRTEALRTSLASMAKTGMNAVPGVVAGGAAGLYTAGRLMDKPMDFDKELRSAASTAYGGASADQVRAGMVHLRHVVNDSVRRFGGTREDTLEGYKTLVGTGAFNAKESDQLLPMVQETAMAARANVKDIANLSMRLKSSLNVPTADMRQVYSKLSRVGQFGGVELDEQAPLLAELSGNYRALGYTGQRGAVAAAVDLQLAYKNAGSKEGARTILDNFYGKVLSTDTAKDFAKLKGANGKGIDLFSEIAARRAQGMDGVEAFMNLTDGVLARSGSDKQVQKILAGANLKDPKQYDAASEAVKAVFERQGIGSFLQDREALRGYLSLSTQRKDRQEWINTAMSDTGGTLDTLAKINIEESPAVAAQKAMAEAAIAADAAFQKLAPTITSVLNGATKLAQEYPQGATGLALLSAAAAVATASLGAMGLAGIVKGGLGGLAGGGGAAAVAASAGAAAPGLLSRLGVWGGRALPVMSLGIGGYGVMTDDKLTPAGKTHGMGREFAAAFGGWGGWAGGAALGATIGSAVPLVGTAAGGIIGGLIGGFGGVSTAKSAYDWMLPSNAQRDYTQFMQPTSHGLLTMGGVQGLSSQLGLGEGKIALDVRVFDDRVTASPTVQQQMPLVRLDAGSTDPGSFLGSMR